MPEHLKALVVILVLASVVFAFARQPACALAMAPADFARRRNLWFAITVIAFLAHSFWVYVILVGALLLITAKREQNKVGLYFFLLFTVPPIGAEISGLGGIRYFFAIDYLRLLSLTILLPVSLILRKHAVAEGAKSNYTDKFLAAYIILNLVLQLNVDSFTNTLRHGFYFFIDIVLPYYVVSRSIKDMQGFRDALMSFVVAGMILAMIGGFEFGKHWLLYSSLEDALGVQWGYSNYLERDGTLRALASTGQPIVLGYVMTVALGIFMFLKKSIPNRAVWMAGMILLIAGLIAPLSRGPWIGAAIMLMVFISTGPKALSRTSLLGLVGLVALPILLSTPIGEKVISYLPFVGTVEEETITYRQLLLEVSTTIIMANPLFGSYDFLLYLEELRQGQGIIDLVNSYLSIALASGLVGLSLFASFFSVILIGIVKGMRGLDKNDERHLLGRVLIAALIGILVIIFTVSSINVIPVIYWAVAGLGVAYARMLALATVSLKVPEASRHVIFPAAIMKAKPERYPGP